MVNLSFKSEGNALKRKVMKIVKKLDVRSEFTQNLKFKMTQPVPEKNCANKNQFLAQFFLFYKINHSLVWVIRMFRIYMTDLKTLE